MIYNSIVDFTNTSKLSKNHIVFSLDLESSKSDAIGISIFGRSNKLYPTPNNTIGTNRGSFPTRFIEMDGKLFYWNDSSSFVNMELLSILSKYDHIDSTNVNGIVTYPEGGKDERQKAAVYFFCKENPIEYKKMETNAAFEYIELPLMKCE